MKYKLIKSYPGSIPLGKEVIYSDTHQVYNYNGGDFFSELPKHQVENLSEFWEKVIEKNYEIISIMSHLNGNKKLLFEDKENPGFWEGEDVSHCATMFLLNQGLQRFSIHSVKRLSDGEIFTVGDKVNSNLSPNNPFIIIDFKFESLEFIRGNKRSCYFKDAEKVKIPLFTTEDGVDIFRGDTLYWVATNENTNFESHDKTFSFNKFHWGLNNQNNPSLDSGNYRWFSTREATGEYILMNKPCLSINDVMTAGYGICSSKPLETIAKIKINDTKS